MLTAIQCKLTKKQNLEVINAPFVNFRITGKRKDVDEFFEFVRKRYAEVPQPRARRGY